MAAQKLMSLKKIENNKHKPEYYTLIADRLMRYTLDIAQPVSGDYFEAIKNISYLYDTYSDN